MISVHLVHMAAGIHPVKTLMSSHSELGRIETCMVVEEVHQKETRVDSDSCVAGWLAVNGAPYLTPDSHLAVSAA